MLAIVIFMLFFLCDLPADYYKSHYDEPINSFDFKICERQKFAQIDTSKDQVSQLFNLNNE